MSDKASVWNLGRMWRLNVDIGREGGFVLLCWDLYGTCIKHAHSHQSVFSFHYPCLWLVAEFDLLYVEGNNLLKDYWLLVILKSFLWLGVVVSLAIVASINSLVVSFWTYILNNRLVSLPLWLGLNSQITLQSSMRWRSRCKLASHLFAVSYCCVVCLAHALPFKANSLPKNLRSSLLVSLRSKSHSFIQTKCKGAPSKLGLDSRDISK